MKVQSVDVAAGIKTALMRLTGREGWRVFTIAEISRESGLSRSSITTRLFPKTHRGCTIEDVVPGLTDRGVKGAKMVTHRF